MLHGVLREAASIACPTTLVVVCAGGAEDDLFLRVIERHPLGNRVDVILMKQQKGKRIGMSDALRALARRGADEGSLIVFMDGDSVMGPGVLRKCLPLFRLFPRLGALTNDELPMVEGARWYRRWYELRFSQRHRLMRSLSLSRRVLTLTGRFSVFRTHLATTEEFISYLESDHLDHWLAGRFRFLTGDDKSTWFYLLKHGWEMLYVPDALVYSMEGSGDEPLRQSFAKMYRWFGNMLRNNGRAIKLGPKPMGFFIWWCLVDQRLSMWTTLVGPIGAIMLALARSPYYLVFYLVGATLARLFYLLLLAVEGHRMSFMHLPQLFYSQWAGAVVKIWVLFRLDKQTWGKARGGQTLGGAADHWARRILPGFQTTLAFTLLVTLVGLGVGVLTIPPWPPLALVSRVEAAVPTQQHARRLDTLVRAESFGVRPDDGADDSAALRRALAALPAHGPATLRLPAGRLQLSEPLVIERPDTRVVGVGRGLTVLEAGFGSSVGDAVVRVAGGGRRRRDARTIARPLAGHDALGYIEGDTTPFTTPFVWLGAPNTAGFLDQLGATQWRRDTPWLQQTLAHLETVAPDRLLFENPAGLDLPVGARVEPVDLLPGVSLRGFTVRVQPPAAGREQVAALYENAYPDFAVDGIALQWTAFAEVAEVGIEMAGRHAINVESSIGATLRDLDIDGAWNKGPGGNGYVRFARSHRNRLLDSTVRNIRHVAFQWSSSGNEIRDCSIEADINFHGGYARDNLVHRTVIAPPLGHPWAAVERTPPNAAWAPPDGSGNRVDQLPVRDQPGD
jgi:glycosyltransferase Alg8